MFDVNAKDIPAIRIANAIGNKVSNKLLFVVGGGIGDRICAEPTLRFALHHFLDCEISLACETPELFSHLEFENVFDFKKTYPIGDRFLCLNTYPIPAALANQFMSANMMNGVDYASISALRMQLPKHYRKPIFVPRSPKSEIISTNYPTNVVLHVGKSWESRTFPAEWWQALIEQLVAVGFRPVLVGKNPVELGQHWKDNCIDLIEKTSTSEFLWICHNAKRMVTNDSSPLHIGATGKGRIAFVSTCRRGELLMHDTEAQMKDFSRRQMWKDFNMAPNHLGEERIDKFPEGHTIWEYLPETKSIVNWLIWGDVK